jgi:XTP/dITP diphosphohydrolase
MIRLKGGQTMSRLLVATNNRGKLAEYRELLAGLPVELTYLPNVGVDFVVEETGATFEENAVLKARAYATASGLLTLADDSGLEVGVLDGEPGIRSARYAGPDTNDVANYRLLLQRLAGVPWERRGACFRCVIAISTPDGTVRTTEGECPGIIGFEPRGSHGFGYDPVFYLPEFHLTMAELPVEVKNQISHRARATMKAREVLREMLSRSPGG